MKKIRTSAAYLLLGLFGVITTAQAGLITDTLGNSAPGFADGSVPGILPILAAQDGQPVPFDAGLGHELFGPNAAGSWTHTYGAIGDPILSATLDIGIVDHDSAAAGDQVALFSFDGFNLTASLNALFNGSGGGDSEYNVYQIDLLAAGVTAAALLDGTAAAVLNLQGPGLTSCLIGITCPPGTVDPVSPTTWNAAHYIFSTLSITTQDVMPPIPIPPALWLFGSGLLGLVGMARRKKST